MPHDGSLLQATVVFLLAVVLLVPLAQRLKMGAVPGYLLAGILIGPSVFGLLGNPDNVARLSEMGVVMLLFVIGLELSPRRLWTMRRALFGIGSLQVGLTAVLLGLLAYWLFDQSKPAAIVLGLGLALVERITRLLGGRIDAAQALAWGLVNRVVPAAGLIDGALALAGRLAEGPASLATIRRLSWQAQDADFAAMLQAEREAQRASGRTRDFAVGVAAFLEKRPARFSGC